MTLIVGCRHNYPTSDYYDGIKNSINSFDEYGDNIILGKIEILPKKSKHDKRDIKTKIEHKCHAHFKSESNKFTTRISKHGLLLTKPAKNIKNIRIDYISCVWKENINIKFLDLDLELKNIKSNKINYLGDIKIFFDPYGKPRKSLKTCKSSTKCWYNIIFYPEKITSENKYGTTYRDINKIEELPISKKSLNIVRISPKNKTNVKIKYLKR